MNEDERFELFIQMKKKGIKQQDLAVALDVTSSWICQFFANKVNMNDMRIQQIKDFMNKQ